MKNQKKLIIAIIVSIPYVVWRIWHYRDKFGLNELLIVLFTYPRSVGVSATDGTIYTLNINTKKSINYKVIENQNLTSKSKKKHMQFAVITLAIRRFSVKFEWNGRKGQSAVRAKRKVL